MNPTKTPIRAKIRQRLASLNDQLQFFLLIESEFLTALSSSRPGEIDSYTTQWFAQNPHAAGLHVPISRLAQFQTTSRSFTFGAYFATSYEVASAFFDEALALISETNPSRILSSGRRNEGPEERYFRILGISGFQTPSVELQQTFTYYRYRRNAFVHVNDLPKQTLIDLAANSGAAINAYWGAVRGAAEFTDSSVASFAEDETIAFIKLLRIGVQRLDTHLASLISEGGAVAYVARRQFAHESTRINSDVLRLRARKLRKRVMDEFGFQPSEANAAREARRFGTR